MSNDKLNYFEFFDNIIKFEEFFWIHDIHLRTGQVIFCRKEGEIQDFMKYFDFESLYKKELINKENIDTLIKTLESDLTNLKNQIHSKNEAINVNQSKIRYNEWIKKREKLIVKQNKQIQKLDCIKYFFDKPKDFIVTEDFWKDVLEKLLTKDQYLLFNRIKSVDVSYKNDFFSYRINVFYEKWYPAIACRSITSEALDFDTINLPAYPRKWVERDSGLVFVTGPTGAWKSTTLISLANFINLNYKKHIISIEDPIEYYYENRKSIVSQREVWKDTLSYAQGIKDALREDPDVIIIWEIRDAEVMRLVLTAADTGHLVLSTLHSTSAIKTISRFVNSFEGADAVQVRTILSNSLIWVLNQRLVNYWFWKYFTAYEVLNVDPSIWAIIREDRTHQISTYLNVIQKGNQSLNFWLSEAVDNWYLSLTNAISLSYDQSSNPAEEFNKILIQYLKIRYMNSDSKIKERLEKINYLNKVYQKEISIREALEENKITLQEADYVYRWKLDNEKLIKTVEKQLMQKYNNVWKVQSILQQIKNYNDSNKIKNESIL